MLTIKRSGHYYFKNYFVVEVLCLIYYKKYTHNIKGKEPVALQSIQFISEYVYYSRMRDTT